MKESVYKAARLNIFEKHADGVITEAQRDALFAALEKEKEDTALDNDKVLDTLDEMEDMYPDLKDDIKGLAKKIKDSAKEPDEADDDKDDDKGDGDGAEAEVSESFKELMAQIKNM